MKNYFLTLFLPLLILFNPIITQAQCTAPAAQPACPTGGTVLPSGTTNIGANAYYYAGSGTQSSTIRMANGTLTVCSGTLNLSFNATASNYGTITVLSGATLYVNAYNMTANNTVINNYGTVDFFDHVSVSGGSSMTVKNAAGATLNFYDSVIVSSTPSYSVFTVVNFGSVNAVGGVFSIPLIYSDNLFCMGQNTVANFAPGSISTSGTIQGSGHIFALATGATKACVLLNANANYTAGINLANVSGIRVSAPTATPITGYGSATIYYSSTGCSYALPLTLLSFTASAVGKGINTVNFKTTAETNVDKYIIESSTNGKSFTPLATIAPRNNALANTYSYTDGTAGATTYYRLKMVDIGGGNSYSATVAVRNVDAAGNMLVSPNPATASISISLPVIVTSPVYYSVYDLTGKAVIANKIPSADGDKMQADVSNLPSGTYLITVRSDNNIWHSRFIKSGN